MVFYLVSFYSVLFSSRKSWNFVSFLYVNNGSAKGGRGARFLNILRTAVVLHEWFRCLRFAIELAVIGSQESWSQCHLYSHLSSHHGELVVPLLSGISNKDEQHSSSTWKFWFEAFYFEFFTWSFSIWKSFERGFTWQSECSKACGLNNCETDLN